MMCCKIKKENIKKFIKTFEEDGWQPNPFGKRGSNFAYIKSFPNKMRYHWRLYEMGDQFYFFLIHYEPTFTGDVPFHIRGLLNRFMPKKEEVQENEKLELSNYEKGVEFFRQFAQEKGILNLCNFTIDEDELKVFSTRFGFISLKLIIESLIDDLKEALNLENNEEFYAILEKLFQIMEFQPLHAEGTDFAIFESSTIKDFGILIRRIKLSELNLKEIDELVKKYHVSSILLVPRKQDTISAELSQKLAYLNISIIHPVNFLKIFDIYKNFLITHEQFQQIFNKKGLIESNFIDDRLQTVNFSDYLKKTMEIFRFLKDQMNWTYFDNLEIEFVKTREFSSEELKSILAFLTYPLINLVLKKSEKKFFRGARESYRAIKNLDEIQFRLKNIKRFLSEIT